MNFKVKGSLKRKVTIMPHHYILNVHQRLFILPWMFLVQTFLFCIFLAEVITAHQMNPNVPIRGSGALSSRQSLAPGSQLVTSVLPRKRWLQQLGLTDHMLYLQGHGHLLPVLHSSIPWKPRDVWTLLTCHYDAYPPTLASHRNGAVRCMAVIARRLK